VIDGFQNIFSEKTLLFMTLRKMIGGSSWRHNCGAMLAREENKRERERERKREDCPEGRR